MMTMIISIRVFKTWESCDRTTYYVELTTNEGYTMTPAGFATGSKYTNYEGLTKEEARERALLTADDWGDFLNIEVDEYVEDSVTYKPDRPMKLYTTRRELKKRGESD